MVASGSYPWLWREVSLLLLLLVAAVARPATYDTTQLRLARATLQRRAVHPRNCPPRHRRRDDFVIDPDPDIRMDTSFWQLWKLQMSQLHNSERASAYQL